MESYGFTDAGPSRPRLSTSEAQTYLYPSSTKRPVREYQLAIARAALLENTLVSLPTGFGKTLIASVVMHNFGRWFPDGACAFVAPTKPLVEQQLRAFCETCGVSHLDCRVLTGEIPPAERRPLWRTARFFFCTPHIVNNDVNSGLADPHRFVCVVYDEVHHAHASGSEYARLAKLFRAREAKVRVLGLSATAGRDLHQVQMVVNVLAIARMHVYCEGDDELRPYSHVKEVSVETVADPEERPKLRTRLLAPARAAANRLAQAGVLGPYSGRPEDIEPAAVAAAERQLDAIAAQSAMRFSGMMTPAQVHELQKAHRLLSALHRAAAAAERRGARRGGAAEAAAGDESVDEDEEEASQRDAGEAEAEVARELAAARAEGLGDDAADELLEEVREWTASAFGGPRSEWQKILMKIGPLGELLRANFGRAAASRVIVFVRYRANVTQLCNHLARHSAADGVKAHAFVGRSRRADLRGGGAAGMDQAEQLRVLRQFRGGEFNVLVATSVAEEGLDIGEVDLIVCFDSVTSPIRLMQRFGRTGRKMDGRCVLLLTQKEGREYRATIDAAERLAAELRYGSRVDMRPNAKFEPLPREMPPPQRCSADLSRV